MASTSQTRSAHRLSSPVGGIARPAGAAARTSSYALAALAAALADPGEPVQLIPDGVFRAVDGRPHGLDGWRLDAAAAERLLATIRAKRARLVINYEHAPAAGQPLPAAGWIDREAISYAPGVGLTAPVKWTARAKDMIDSGEYAYLSPVIRYDAKTGDISDLLYVGLTNTPALDGMPPLAALAEQLDTLFPTDEDDLMDLAALRASLDLPDDADEAAILQAVSDLKDTAGKVAGLTDELAAARSDVPDLSAYVPKAVHEEAVAQLREALDTNAKGEVDALVEQGLAAGRIPGKATADWLRGQPAEAVRAWLADAPALAALKSRQSDKNPPPAEHGFTAALAEEFGDEDTYNAFRRAEKGGLVQILGGLK